jgi:hypothetical protein
VLFYKLPQRFQKLYTMNGGRPYRDILPVVSEEHPWHVSGGMHHVKRSDWRNATGLAIPDGAAIDLWEEWQDVGAFGPVPKVRWRFPEGTVAYDVLFKVDGNHEHVFEVRTSTKQAEGWDAGTTYRPEPEMVGEENGWTWGFPQHGLEADASVFAGRFVARPKFRESRKVVVDNGLFTPQGYLGAGMSCLACHRKVGELTGYAQGRRGDDGRFSWHPFDNAGKIDGRWPIVRK